MLEKSWKDIIGKALVFEDWEGCQLVEVEKEGRAETDQRTSLQYLTIL